MNDKSNFWLKLNKPIFILAPMYDVTDYVFREIVTYTHKPDVFYTEFVNCDSLFSKGKDINLLKFKYSKSQKPIVAQIWGTNPETFYKTASLVQDLGFDGIDINMGCPQKHVVSIGAGAALINNKELTKNIINATKNGAPNLPLSIKTRIGYKDIQTQDWISYLLSFKPQALTIHGRTAKQLSTGSANWDEIGLCVKLRDEVSPNTLIIGNGDVDSYEKGLLLCEKHNLDGIMIGRGIFNNLWVFDKNINTVDSDKYSYDKEKHVDLLIKHIKLFKKHYKGIKNFDVLKKFIKIYIKDYKGSSKVRLELMESTDYDELITKIKTLQ